VATHRISIGMPTYNCEKYIGQSIESCLAQTYGDFELVISDNASTDGTEQVCRQYAARDKRIRYIRRTENIGGPGNFRYVFGECTGEFHKWTTADDYIAPTLLEKCIGVLDRDPATVLCYPKKQLINFEGKKIQDYDDNLHLQEDSPSERFVRLLTTIGLCQAHLGLIRRAACARTRLIASERASDVHFLAELALYGKFQVFPETLFFRRYHEQSSSWSRKDNSHQRKYYDPAGKKRYGSHTWKKYAGLYSGMWRSPIGLTEKLKLTAALARMAMWERTELRHELANQLQSNK
jgi:glycosyltransferase involved in cell wall biosynthesis